MSERVAFGRRGISAQRQGAARPQAAIVAPSTIARNAEGEGAPAIAGLFGSLPLMTFCIAALLGLIFVLETRFAFDMGDGYKMSPESLLAFGAASRDLVFGSGEIWRLGLAPLLHASLQHLVGNGVAMVLIGVLLEPMIGRGWFAAIFALSAIGAVAASLHGNPPAIPTVGASGAISGLIGAAFVMSFSAESPEIRRRMLRRVVFFGGPAVLPLFFGASGGGTDYYAHVGGAIVGCGVAFALEQLWDRNEAHPPYNRKAAIGAAFALALSLFCAAAAAPHYDGYREIAAKFIPLAEFDAGMRPLINHSPGLAMKYPDDPMSQVLLAAYDAEHGAAWEAEPTLRRALTAPSPLRPALEPKLHDMARALLAIVVEEQHRRPEALEIAAPLCNDLTGGFAIMLRKARLCSSA